MCSYSTASISGNTIYLNTASVEGAGIDCSHLAPSSAGNTITANVIAGNTSAGQGGGICCASSSASIASNTISGNGATYGGGLYCNGSTATLTNSIVAFSNTGGGVHLAAGTPPTVTYCDVYGNTLGSYVGMADATGANGNISQDPLFADAANRNFRLKSKGGRWNDLTKSWVTDTVTSPCLDAGDPKSAYNLEPAPNGSRINMGFDGNTLHASKSVPPTVISTVPTANATAISAQSPVIKVVFSVPMNQSAAQAAFVMLPSKPAGSFSWVGNEMDYTISTALAPLTTYTVAVLSSAKSATGVSMLVAYKWSFTTDNRPAVVSSSPTGTTVAQSSPVKIGFNMAMNAAATQAAFTLCKFGTVTALPGAFSWSGNTVQFQPTPSLLASTKYTATLATTATGSNGATLAAVYSWSFTTGIAAAAATPASLTAAAAPTAAGAQIVVNLSAAADVTVSIRNLAGREIAVLTPGRLEAGVSTLLWNGKSTTGTKVPGGTYLLQVTARSADGSSCSAMSSLRR
jgi:Bacterial Ig-like domain/FlgD Ig-like domain/Disaggregatase related